ncbi:MAG: HAD hydrolase family protein, partial [Actinomycetota bacterium]|nr:HAD hydrolase family protein [Actinomycetota bacterium]
MVATDLDGTFLDLNGQVSPRSVAAVRAARAAGIHVIPVTGRPPQALW